MQIEARVAAAGSVLVSQMPQTLHVAVPHVAEAYAPQSPDLLGAPVVLDTAGAGEPDPEALSCEREDRVLLVPAVPTRHSWGIPRIRE